jgi:hypothetical protein
VILVSTPHVFVLQIMDGLYQLSEVAGSDRIFPVLETSDGALGYGGLAREKLRGKLFRLCPELVQILRVNALIIPFFQ